MSTERQPKFKVGDIVKLNAGGPEMAIDRIKMTKEYGKDYEYFDGKYNCQWFAGKKLDSGSFPEESLILVKNDKEGEAAPRHSD